ncbi:MAG: hypothetical protein SPF22_00695 [Candidatus Onthovivens sp.]|nr:hypothetical protein [Candidatus Onthovivens sp.]
MALIKIKFKDTLTLNTNFDILINFTSNNESYSKMKVQTRTFAQGTIKVLFYGNNGVCYNLSDWTDNNYQYIEIDTSQPNFQTFINAMKSNIEGVELEAGTYKWVDVPSANVSSDLNNKDINFNFNSSNLTFNKIVFDAVPTDNYLVITYDYEGAYYGDNEGTSWEQQYQIITTTSNQYVDYDFYNYAILGNQLVKQATVITYTCKWYLDGTLVNTSTFTHEQLTGIDYNVLGSVFKVMLSAEILAQYDYGVNLNGETSNASLGSDNVITIEAFKSNIVFNITSNGTTTLATKNTYVPCDIDFNVNVPSVQLQEKSEYITSNTETIITPDTGKALSKVTITTDVPQMTEVATSAEMDAKLKEDNVSLYYKYTGTTDDKYTNGDIYQVQEG